MLKILIYLGFVILFIIFWRWVLSNNADYPPPPGRI